MLNKIEVSSTNKVDILNGFIISMNEEAPIY